MGGFLITKQTRTDKVRIEMCLFFIFQNENTISPPLKYDILFHTDHSRFSPSEYSDYQHAIGSNIVFPKHFIKKDQITLCLISRDSHDRFESDLHFLISYHENREFSIKNPDIFI